MSSYTLEELAAHHQATGSVVSRYVPESDYKRLTVARDTLDGIVSENIARRCEIEQHLMNVATGKAPLLTAQDCRILALRLGTPKAQWNATIKKL